MTDIEFRLAKLNGKTEALYKKEVNRLIRAKYSLSDEFAILRQRDEKPEEFAEYTACAEECKRITKIALGL